MAGYPVVFGPYIFGALSVSPIQSDIGAGDNAASASHLLEWDGQEGTSFEMRAYALAL